MSSIKQLLVSPPLPRRSLGILFAIEQYASPSICLFNNCQSLKASYRPSDITQFQHRLTTSSSTSSSEPSHNHKKCRLPSDFLSTLQTLHPNLAISTNSYDLDSHGHGESYHPTQPPDAVIRPTNVEEIQDVFRLCCRERKAANDDTEELPTVELVSIIPYGAGTSLEGHLEFLFPNSHDEQGEIVDIPSSYFANHNDAENNKCKSYKKVRVQRKGGISVDMCHFQSIGDVGADSFVKVGAGVTRNTLNEALRHTGMQFMVDPGADATIGGMTSCGASGTAAVKYGTMRENVLEMNCIFPPTIITSASDESDDINANTIPPIVHLGCNALKSSAGYNLPALLTGSEGTLGVLTEVTVKLHPIPANVIAASCAFKDLHSAAEVVAIIIMMGVPVSRIELLDEVSIQAFNQSLCSDDVIQPMEVKATLFMEFNGHTETSVLEDLQVAKSICIDEYEGTNFASASDESTRQSLWAARHRLYYSAVALRSGCVDDDNGATPRSTIITDVCVPLSSFADIISATANDVHELGVVGPCFGHAGDGNFHCILPLRKNDTQQYKDNVNTVIANVTDRAIGVGGSCTGEHGVGYGKMKYLESMYGSSGIVMMGAVKQAIDPFNIMNPGKIVSTSYFDNFK